MTLSNVMEMKFDVIKQIRNYVTLAGAVICCRIIHCNFPLLLKNIFLTFEINALKEEQ